MHYPYPNRLWALLYASKPLKHFINLPHHSQIHPHHSSMLITPILSPSKNPTDIATNQPKIMAENSTAYQDFPAADMQSENSENTWHAPLSLPPPTIACIHASEGAAVTKAGELLDSKSKNWSRWSQQMALLFKLFNVQEYVQGSCYVPLRVFSFLLPPPPLTSPFLPHPLAYYPLLTLSLPIYKPRTVVLGSLGSVY